MTVAAVDNAVDGPDKTVTVSGTVSNSIGGYSNPADLTLTIADDDATPKVTLVLSRSTIDESGTHNAATVTATMSPASVQSTTVTVAAAAGTNAAAGDFELSSNKTLTIAAGATESTGTVSVTAVDNALDESDKKVTVSGTAANTQGATSPDAVELTISDDDDAPAVTLILSRTTIDESGTSTSATVTAELDAASGAATTVTVSAAAGTNAAAGDFELSSDKTLTIAAGATESTGTVTITAVDNAVDGPDKTVTVSGTVSNSIGGYSNPADLTLTIADDEATPKVTLVLSRSTIDESGTHNAATVTATMSPASVQSTTVTVAAAPGTNAASGDYALSSNKTLTIAAGATESTGTVTVTAVDNAVDGPDKTVTVSGTAENTRAATSPDAVTLTIADDDATPKVTLVLSRSTIDESGTHNAATVTATMSPASVQSTTVTVAAAPGTNAASGDYALSSNKTLTIAAGATESTGTVTVTAVDNAVDGPDKIVTVSGTAANSQGATSPDAVELTIKDDDGAPTVTLILSRTTINESGTHTSATVTAELDAVAGAATTVTVSAAAGTNAAAGDFELSSDKTLTIAAGATESTGTVTITAVDNAVDGPDKTVTVSGTVSNSIGGYSNPADVTLTIADDDATPKVTLVLSRSTIDESGTHNAATVTATMSPASVQSTTVTVAAAPGTNAAAGDYALSSNKTLTIAAGATESTGTVTVTAVDNALDGPDKIVTVSGTAANSQGATSPDVVELTIKDDDGAPTVTLVLSRTTINESGTSTSATVTAELDAVAGAATTVTVSAAAGTNAAAGDFELSSNKTLTIAAGATESTGTVTITAVDNALDGPDKTVTVAGTVSNSIGGYSNPADVTLTIADDDATPKVTLVLSRSTIDESGTHNAATVTATMSPASVQSTTVTVSAAAGTNAAAGDYALSSNKTLTIAAGATESTGTVTVTAVDNTVDGPDKTVTVSGTAANSQGATSPDAVELTIKDDDGVPTVTLVLSRTTINESGTSTSATVTAELDAVAGAATTVTVSAAAGTNAAAGDFELSSNKTLTIAAGATESTGTVTITAVDNAVDGPDKTVTVSGTVSNSIGGYSNPANVTLTIADDDATPKVTLVLSRSTIDESGTHKSATVTVTMSPASVQSTTVTVAAAAGTNAAAGDFELSSNKTLTIAAGATESTGTVTVTAVDNGLDGPDKTVTVSGTAENTRGATSPDAVTLTIADDEVTPAATLMLSPQTISENGAGNASTVTAMLSHPSSALTTLTISATPGTNAAAGDFALSTNTALTIAVGATTSTGTVTITANDNDDDEADKQVIVSGAAANALGVSDPSDMMLTITDDDMSGGSSDMLISISSHGVTEGDLGTVDLAYTVRLRPASMVATSVDYADAGSGTATPGVDYVPLSPGMLVFAPGDTVKTVTVQVRGDELVELDETVLVALSNPVGASIAVGTATGTIVNDDAPELWLEPDAVIEGDHGSQYLIYTAKLHPVSSHSVTVSYSDAGTGTATPGIDYDFLEPGTLVFAPGEREKSFGVIVHGDTAPEDDETVIAVLSHPANADIVPGRDAATATIVDDDLPLLVIGSPTVKEGDGEPTALVFPVTLSVASGRQVKAKYADGGGGTATSGTDYEPVESGELVFAPGETAKTVSVAVLGDELDEPDETVELALSEPRNAELATAAGLGTIVDDDAEPVVSVGSPSVEEGDFGAAPTLEYAVTLSAASALQVTVRYADGGGGTATSGTDYEPVESGELVFAPGETAKTVSVVVLGDELDEPDETVELALSEPRNADLATAAGLGTIVDDDAEPIVSVSSPSVEEGDFGAASALEYAVTLSAASALQVTVRYADGGGGTAASGTDYETVEPGELVFAPGETAKTVSVVVLGDELDEPDETVELALSEPRNAELATAAGLGTIVDDDAEPVVSVGSPSVEEGDFGAVPTLEYAVTLSAASALQVTVGYADGGGGTAASGTDYEPVEPGELVFAPGETAKTVSVVVVGDELDEPDETVELALSEPRNAELATAAGLGTIVDDDAEPVVSVGSPSVEEGDFGAAPTLEYAVTLSAASALQVTVRYADGGGGTATSGTDYETVEPGELVFAPGETAKTVSVVVVGDELDEPDETVELALSQPRNAELAAASGLGTIVDDDAGPVASVGSPSVEEGDFGAAPTLEYAVTLSAASALQVTVRYADGGGGTATSGTDYEPVESGELVFAPGETVKTVSVVVVGDELDEPDETVELALGEPRNAGLATAAGLGTIVDDDAEPVVSVGSPSVEEGDFGATSVLEYAVTLSAASGRHVTVGYADGGGGTATSGTDYEPVEPGELVFAPGETAKTVSVVVVGDELDEPDETVELALSEPRNAELATAAGLGTIVDDDAEPIVSVSSPSVEEGDFGAASALEYAVTLSAASGRHVTVGYADGGGGTATSGTDYEPVEPGELVFAPGETAKTVSVVVLGDKLDEPDETVELALGEPRNAVLATAAAAAGLGTIVDDDAEPIVSVSSPSVEEGDFGAAPTLEYAVTLSAASALQVTVKYADGGGGTAVSGTDYEPVEPGELVFAPGETAKTVSVVVVGDKLAEPDETVELALSEPRNAELATAAGLGTIVDDDAGPVASVGSPSVEEGDFGAAPTLEYAVTLSAASALQVTVRYADGGGGTATSGTDYEPVEPGELVFAPGETAKTVSVVVVGDELDEPDETVELALSEPRNAELATAAGLGTIVDDDAEPIVSVSSPSVEEGDFGAAPTLEYAVTLSAASALQVTVRYADGGGGTAASGTDYKPVESGELVFAPGETAKTVSVVVVGDELDEPDETVELALSEPENAVLAAAAAAAGLGTIVDDDAEPVVSVGSPSVEEGDFGAVPTLEYAVTLSAASTRQVTVRYADGGGGTAASGTDYEPVEPGELAFAPGETAKTVSVIVLGDELDEPDETVELVLSQPRNAELAVASGLGTIVDDDAEPIVSVSSPSAEEGDFGAASALEYAVTLSAASGRQVTVGYADGGGGTATSGTDYETVEPGKLVFAPGETAKTVSVVVLGDKLDEPDETVELVLSEPENAVLAAAAAAAGLGTIVDDDVDLMPTFDASVPPQHYTEGDPVPPLVLPLAKGGDGPLVYGLAPAPPPGITFDPGSRTLSGTPSSGLESTPYEYTATDQDGDAATLSFTITVVPRQTRIDRIERASRAILPVVARTWTDMAATAVEARVDHAESGTGVRIGAWGNGEYRQLSGGESHPVDWSGEIGGGGVALDAKLGPNFVAGVAATHLEGWFDYTDVGGQENVEGTYESRVTGLHPYLGWRAPNGSRLYGTVAWGRNDVAIKDDEAGHQAGGGSLAALAVGGNVRLAGGSAGRTTLDVRGGAQGTRIGLESNGDLLGALSLGVYRARLSLIGSHTFAFGSGASLRPSAELGLRRDGGDGQTGSGMEVGGKLAWTALGSRLRMEARAHALLDGPDGMQEWGAGGFLELDPGANGTGLSMKLAPSWGPAFSGVGQTWEQNPVAASPHRPPALPRQSRVEAEIGYGFPVGELGLLQPFGAVQPGGGGGASHLYRFGGRFRARPDLGLGVGVEALYRDGARDGQLPKYGLKLGIAFKR